MKKVSTKLNSVKNQRVTEKEYRPLNTPPPMEVTSEKINYNRYKGRKPDEVLSEFHKEREKEVLSRIPRIHNERYSQPPPPNSSASPSSVGPSPTEPESPDEILPATSVISDQDRLAYTTIKRIITLKVHLSRIPATTASMPYTTARMTARKSTRYLSSNNQHDSNHRHHTVSRSVNYLSIQAPNQTTSPQPVPTLVGYYPSSSMSDIVCSIFIRQCPCHACTNSHICPPAISATTNHSNGSQILPILSI
ncbi:unnamed protein product [Clavelina lepadiformis]|uniref:Uncharacterized protein n=1 Tax=Clavelina lepadiformis TaxID=159417 RepID=A0ABP0G0J2_CLALP